MTVKKYWLVFIISLFCLSSLYYCGFSGDDTYIHLQFVRNLAAGHGISFNAGEVTYGTTALLWVLINAVFCRAGLDPFVTAKLLSWLFSALAIIALWSYYARGVKRPALAAFGLLLLIAGPLFMRWHFSGMETSLALFLIILFAQVYEHERDRGFKYAPALITLLLFVRPESIVMLVAIGGDLLARQLADKSGSKMNAFWSFYGLLICLAGPAYLIIYRYFGQLLPNTILAKSHYFSPLVVTSRILLDIIIAAAPAIMILAGGSLLALFWRKGPVVWRLGCEKLYQVLFIIGIIILFVGTGATVATRHVLLLVPFITILATLLLDRLWAESGWRDETKNRILCCLVLITLVIDLGFTYFLIGPETFRFYAFQREYKKAAVWLKDKTAPNSKVAIADIGIMGYYSDRYIIDLCGLVTPAVTRQGRVRYLKQSRPEYLVTRTVDRNLIGELNINKLKQVVFTRVYAATLESTGLSSDRHQQMVIYRLKWLQ